MKLKLLATLLFIGSIMSVIPLMNAGFGMYPTVGFGVLLGCAGFALLEYERVCASRDFDRLWEEANKKERELKERIRMLDPNETILILLNGQPAHACRVSGKSYLVLGTNRYLFS